jgi:hypothetical protein
MFDKNTEKAERQGLKFCLGRVCQKKKNFNNLKEYKIHFSLTNFYQAKYSLIVI